MLKRVAAIALLLLQGGVLSAPVLCIGVEHASAHECETPAPAPLSIASQDDTSVPRCLGSLLCLRPGIAPLTAAAAAEAGSPLEVCEGAAASGAPRARSLSPPFHPPRA